ncbi:MAG: wax ester/triacylglycerol synthase family O-acyltransferase, partial [Acidimicrobiia bacterium]|nr:wax ester/triacylglycerol synthase family O-acyltransferase [Acidimicrobiia bacterium]
VPFERHPVWVDDAGFDISIHVRHSSLPLPGTEEQLKELVGHLASLKLDRTKPLWELWVVEGLEDERFALVAKVHHCMIDGLAGVDLMAVMFNMIPTEDVESAPAWHPRPTPSGAELVAGEAGRRLRSSIDLVKDLSRLAQDAQRLTSDAGHRLRAVSHSLGSGWLSTASETPLNQRMSPNRRIDWQVTDLNSVKAVKNALGGTVNDTILAIAAGAIREFLLNSRDFAVDGLDYRVMAPVSVRSSDHRHQLGNQVAMWLVRLPLDEPDPVKRLEKIREETRTLKETDQALGASTLVQVSAGAPSTLVALGARLAAGSIRPFNMTVTNVPGPQFPLYLLGSRLISQVPLVPLWAQHGLGLAQFSYDGNLIWGLNSDRDLVPDLREFGEAIQSSLAELIAAI